MRILSIVRTLSILLLSGISLGLVVTLQAEANSPIVSEQSDRTTTSLTASRGLFSAQTEQRGDVSPRSGSGRRK